MAEFNLHGHGVIPLKWLPFAIKTEFHTLPRWGQLLSSRSNIDLPRQPRPMEVAFFSRPAAGGGQGWEVSKNGNRGRLAKGDRNAWGIRVQCNPPLHSPTYGLPLRTFRPWNSGKVNREYKSPLQDWWFYLIHKFLFMICLAHPPRRPKIKIKMALYRSHLVHRSLQEYKF